MLQQGIIVESCSPWMAPAVFVRKKPSLVCGLSRVKQENTEGHVPIPLPDEVQDKLANSKIFSTLDLQQGYWQMPVNPQDCHKTAFCPGPGMGLFHTRYMPFGLTGAPSSFQRLMNQLFRDLPFVTIYIDDIHVHSANRRQCAQHLRQVFAHLSEATVQL